MEQRRRLPTPLNTLNDLGHGRRHPATLSSSPPSEFCSSAKPTPSPGSGHALRHAAVLWLMHDITSVTCDPWLKHAQHCWNDPSPLSSTSRDASFFCNVTSCTLVLYRANAHAHAGSTRPPSSRLGLAPFRHPWARLLHTALLARHGRAARSSWRARRRGARRSARERTGKHGCLTGLCRGEARTLALSLGLLLGLDAGNDRLDLRLLQALGVSSFPSLPFLRRRVGVSCPRLGHEDG